MIINLSEIRVITYRINETDNINKIEYIVSFPSGYKYTFPALLNMNTGEVNIKLPILLDIIQMEFDGIGYLQLTMSDGVIKEMFKETIKFVKAQRIEINPVVNDEVNFDKNLDTIGKAALKPNEVLISHSNTLQFLMSNVNRNKK